MRVFLLLFTMILFADDLFCDEITFEPSQDAFVCDCIPGATNPAMGNQYLAQGMYGSCYNRTFISWDLSVIPPGSTIDLVEFQIYCGQFYGSPMGQMGYYRLIEEWNENTVSYSNMPGHTTDGAILLSTWPTGGSWHIVDITDFATEWYEGVNDNYGIYCHTVGASSTSDCLFYSSRGPYPSFNPRLVVTFTPPSDLEGMTWCEIKAVSSEEEKPEVPDRCCEGASCMPDVDEFIVPTISSSLD